MLVQDALIADTGTDVIELQSQIVVDWTGYLVYSPLDDSSTTTFWNRDVLISIREFENEVKISEEYRVSCLADLVLSAGSDQVICDDVRGFLSPLDLFGLIGVQLSDLETMSDQQI